MPPGPIRVRVIAPDGAITNHPLDNGEHVIGRPSKIGDPSIKLNDRYISREHALIIKEPGSVVIIDKNSLNGTRLNGRRLVPGQPQPVRDGDVLQIEAFQLQVVFSMVDG